MDLIRKTLLETDSLQIGLFAARPVSDACGDVERQGSHVVVLPVSGVFCRHDAPGRHVTGTPSHAVLVAADTPYRVSYPGGIGDPASIGIRSGGKILCAHADQDGRGMHWKLPGETCTAAEQSTGPEAGQ